MPIEKLTQMKIKNKSGEWVYLYPKSKIEQIEGLKEELDFIKQQLGEITYISPTINSFSPSNNITVYEKGSTVNSIRLLWSYNKTITSQNINGVVLEPLIREYTYTTPINSNITFTINCGDGKKTASKTATIQFCNGRYYGCSNAITNDSNLINSLINKSLSDSRYMTMNINCGIDQYAFYCIPTRLGTPTFTVGQFSGGFNKVATINYTNNYNFTESYDIWKSTNKNLGILNITVS